MRFERYSQQSPKWPATGRHIMAHFDEESIVVYQAYRPSIARHAVTHQSFGGDFSYNRMSWIKPNFLWMMYRCGWATKEGQEHVLAVRLRRKFFDQVLLAAIPSTHDPSRFQTHEDWKAAVSSSEVRLQWDPDHDPTGSPLERKAVQLGLRGEMLRRYGTAAILSIDDITPFVEAERGHAKGDFSRLTIPEEQIYLPADPWAARAVGITMEL